MVLLTDSQKIQQLQNLVSRQTKQIKVLQRQVKLKERAKTAGIAPDSPVNKDSAQLNLGKALSDANRELLQAQWRQREANLTAEVQALKGEVTELRKQGRSKDQNLKSAADQIEVLARALELRVSSLAQAKGRNISFFLQ